MRRLPALSFFVATMVLLAGGRAAAEATDPDHAGLRHRVVPITGQRLNPDLQRIGSGDAFGWLNYSTMVARVSFDREVVDRLTCRSASKFRLVENRFESGDIQSGDFTTLCSLAPGEYDYRVELRPSDRTGAEAGLVTHDGKIIVE